MGHRTLKRVPLDFSWPLHKVWDGYVCNLGGPCPEEGKTCFNGSTAAGKWLDAICRLIDLVGAEAAVAPHVEEYKKRGRIYPHPYLEEWSQAPRTEIPRGELSKLRDIQDQGERFRALARFNQQHPPKLLPLTKELAAFVAGLGARDLGEGLRGSDGYLIEREMKKIAKMPESWGVCPVCEGHADDPAKRAAAEAWKETEPPVGDGWQLWETCSEGSPVSPVFASADELATWCAESATTFADYKATKEQWLKMFATETGCDVGTLFVMSEGKAGVMVDFDDADGHHP